MTPDRHTKSWPLLTADLPGTGGTYKVRPEDFRVTERPRYEPCGSGTHVYAWVEKTGLTTPEAITLIAGHVGRRPRDIGYAGLKDAQAVTGQWTSVEHVDPQRLLALSHPGLRILRVRRHGNKLRLGHLAGNRFQIRLRDLAVGLPEARARAEAVLAVLTRRGLPNYFGPQRFGRRGDNHLVGEALLLAPPQVFLERWLAVPGPADGPVLSEARRHVREKDYAAAAARWPGAQREESRVLRVLARTGGDARQALRVLDRRRRQFFISAFQSALFNRVLARRLASLDTILDGDVATKHANGACFAVTDPATEAPRCAAFEISPTGPLLGPRLLTPTGAAGAIEAPVLAPAQRALAGRETLSRDLGRGGRRALRVRPREVAVTSGADAHGPYLELGFELDPGCYATTLLAEVMGPVPGEAERLSARGSDPPADAPGPPAPSAVPDGPRDSGSPGGR